MAAHSHFTAQLKQARGKSAERQNLLEYRLAILETQNRVFNSEACRGSGGCAQLLEVRHEREVGLRAAGRSGFPLPVFARSSEHRMLPHHLLGMRDISLVVRRRASETPPSVSKRCGRRSTDRHIALESGAIQLGRKHRSPPGRDHQRLVASEYGFGQPVPAHSRSQSPFG